MAQVFPPNLAGFHDPALDLWHEVWQRTESAPRLPLPTTEGELESSQLAIRERLLASIGGVVERPSGFDVAATVQPGRRITLPEGQAKEAPTEGQDVTAHTLIFESAPKVRVPAVLYRPASANAAEKLPAVVFLCGHSPEGKAAPAYQAACYALAAAGFLVLTFDPFGQGERLSFLDADGAPQVPWGTADHSYAGIPSWWQGASSIRYFLNDAQAAIDVLIGYAGADPARIGATGNSGGGMLTSMLMALDSRIAAAAPGTFLTTRAQYLYAGAHQDAEQVLLGATAAGLDHESFLVATAPRPVCILAAQWDFFPIEGARQVFQRARPLYELVGARDSLQLVEVSGPHTYHPEHVAAAVEFFVRHLGPENMHSSAPLSGAGVLGSGVLPPEELNATRTGQISTDEQDTRFIPELSKESLQRVAEPLVNGKQLNHSHIVHARIWLRDQALGGVREFPTAPSAPWDRVALKDLADSDAPTNGTGQGPVTARKLPVSSSHMFLAWPQSPTSSAQTSSAQTSSAQIWNSGIVPFGQLEPVREFSTIVLLDQGTNDFAAWAQEKNKLDLQHTSVLVLDVRGRGPLAPYAHKTTDKNAHSSSTYKLLTDLLWLGDSLAAGQLYDVLSAIYRWGAPAVRIAGVGYGAYLARLAAFIEPRINTLHLDDEYVDPERACTQRLWDEGRGSWHGVLPGLSARAPWPLIVEKTDAILTPATAAPSPTSGITPM